MNSERQIWTAYNEITRKNEIIDIELAELLPGKQVIRMFWTNSCEKYVTIPGASLYIVNAQGKLELNETMNAKSTTSTDTNEPQTVAYQAAVDNVWFENKRNAREVEVSFNHNHELMWDRWDYVAELEAAIDAEVFHASHSYRLYSK